MEITVKNNMVEFVLLNGNSNVSGRMSEGEAKQLLKSGKVQQKGDSVIVDGKFVFGLNGKDAIDEIQPKKAEPKAEKKAEKKVEKKTEDKPLKEVKGKSLTKKPRKKKK